MRRDAFEDGQHPGLCCKRDAGLYKEGPGEINFPVVCGGVVVNPGDIIVGDADDDVVIRAEDALNLLDKASAKSRAEQQTLLDIENGTWARDWIGATLAAKGCAPGC